MRALVFNSAHLFPGLKFQLGDECFLSKDGLKDYVETLMISPSYFGVQEAISFRGRIGDYEVNFACAGALKAEEKMWVKSWVNGIFTDEGGTHVSGMNKALAAAGLKPRIAAISVILDSPRFGSPTTSKLVNTGVEVAVEKILCEYFESKAV